MKKSEFIPTIAPIVQKVNKELGKPLFASVVIAQAICESGWGQSTIMMKANAIFGIKAGSSWKGKVYNTKTKECYDGINYTTITDTFRAYDSLEESIKDYFNLICKLERYKNALHTKTPYECITAIKNGGYATSPTYVNTIMSIINSNNLIKYDGDNVENVVNNSTMIDELVQQTLQGKYGNGEERKQKLGSMYQAVQDKINAMYDKTKIKKGDKVEVLKNIQYNGKPFRSYYKIYNVIDLKGDRAVIGIDKTVTCAININNIRKV